MVAERDLNTEPQLVYGAVGIEKSPQARPHVFGLGENPLRDINLCCNLVLHETFFFEPFRYERRAEIHSAVPAL